MVAGGTIGLIVAVAWCAVLILAAFLIRYLGPDGSFNNFVQCILFLSILCAAFLIFTFAVFGENGKIRTYPIKLIMYLSGCLISAFTFLLISQQPPIVLNRGACFFVGLMIHYSFLANFCWTFCIAFNFYRMIVAQDRDTRSYEKWYHLFSWGFPAIPMIILASLQYYGRVPGAFECYISAPTQTAILVSFFVPGLLIVSANSVLFVFVAREIRETLKGAAEIRGGGPEKKDTKRQIRVYMSIVFSIGLAWLFGFISVLFPPSDGTLIPYQIFDTLFNVFVPMQGYFLFGSYCVNEKIFKKYAAVFGKCCGCCRVVVEKLDSIATASTTGTSGSKTGSKTASTPGSQGSSRSANSVKTANSTNSGSDASNVEMSTDSRF